MPLKTIPVSPFALARGYATSLISRVRETVELAQQMASTVRSVDVVSEDIALDLAPQRQDARSMLMLPMGRQDVGLRGGVNLERDGPVLLVTLNLDAFLLDKGVRQRSGMLVSQATCRLNTKLRVVMRETVDVTPEAAPDSKPKRARKKLPRASS